MNAAPDARIARIAANNSFGAISYSVAGFSAAFNVRSVSSTTPLFPASSPQTSSSGNCSTCFSITRSASPRIFSASGTGKVYLANNKKAGANSHPLPPKSDNKQIVKKLSLLRLSSQERRHIQIVRLNVVHHLVYVPGHLLHHVGLLRRNVRRRRFFA